MPIALKFQIELQLWNYWSMVFHKNNFNIVFYLISSQRTCWRWKLQDILPTPVCTIEAKLHFHAPYHLPSSLPRLWCSSTNFLQHLQSSANILQHLLCSANFRQHFQSSKSRIHTLNLIFLYSSISTYSFTLQGLYWVYFSKNPGMTKIAEFIVRGLVMPAYWTFRTSNSIDFKLDFLSLILHNTLKR